MNVQRVTSHVWLPTTLVKPVLRKLRALLVTDDCTVRETVVGGLPPEEFTVDYAESVREALSFLQEQVVDLLVLDYGLADPVREPQPRVSDAFRRVLQATAFVPVVLLCPRKAELSHATLLMADVVLRHPVNETVLLDAVEAALIENRRRRARRKLAKVKLRFSGRQPGGGPASYSEMFLP